MNEHEHDATATAPHDEPKAEAHPHAHEAAPEPTGGDVPEAEADPEHAPEPAPAAPPELADTAAAEVESVATEEPKVGDEPAKPSKRAKSAKTPKPVAATVPDAEDAEPEEPTGTVAPTEPPVPAEPESKKKWYAIKVQSGREDTIKAAILRKVAIEGLEEHFGQIVIPYEEEVIKKTVRVKDKKTGEYTTQEKKVTRKKKKFQGYLFAELEFNDRILYLFRETSGVGDFLNLRTKPGQQPTPEPMPEHEVQSMLTGERHTDPLKKGNAKVRLDFEKGDRVRIREGPFANSEGEVKVITEPKDPTDTPKVTVVVTLWGRPVDVELDYWQVEKA